MFAGAAFVRFEAGDSVAVARTPDGQTAPPAHTAGCEFVEIFATPGWRIPSVCYSRQYQSHPVKQLTGRERKGPEALWLSVVVVSVPFLTLPTFLALAFKRLATLSPAMAHVQIHRDDIELDEPTLVEGLPGVGLVGKIAADHLVDAYDMVHYGTAHCEGLPEIAVYSEGDPTVRGPVRLYADAERDLLVLRSDAPVSAQAADAFTGCLVEWFRSHDVMPIFLSGMPAEKDGVPSVYGIATGDGGTLIETADIDTPNESGAVTGPTGALVHECQRVGLTGVGLVVEADPQFPDPEAARAVLNTAIGPLGSLDIDTEALVEQAEEIGQAKERLAKQMQESDEESTSARPLGFQ